MLASWPKENRSVRSMPIAGRRPPPTTATSASPRSRSRPSTEPSTAEVTTRSSREARAQAASRPTNPSTRTAQTATRRPQGDNRGVRAGPATAALYGARVLAAPVGRCPWPPSGQHGPVSSGDGLIGGRFRTIRRLGAGGMGSVVLAEDEILGRLVAIKRLHPGSGPELLQRFRQEMRIAASLSHPNVVGLLDAIVEDGDVLLIMEYVDGETLSARLKRGPVDAGEALRITTALGEAVDAIHARGILHRDIKPANILLGVDGSVKLADLGLARA